jgi:hypothetical protein
MRLVDKRVRTSTKTYERKRSIIIITIIITYSKKQSPSWAANQFSASQEIPRIL